MRKIALLSVFLFAGFVVGTATAGTCEWEFGDFSSNADEYIYKSDSKTYRVECDSSKCGNRTWFFAPAGHVFKGKKYNYNQLYRCAVESIDDLWIRVDKADLSLCPGYTKTDCDDGWYYMDLSSGTVTEVSGSGSVIHVNNKSDICYFCNGDVQLNAKCEGAGGKNYPLGNTISSKAGCKAAEMDTALESYDNLASNAVCDATCATNGWNITLKSGSCKAGYVPDEAKKKCIPTPEQQSKEEQCKNSGGAWVGTKCSCDAAKGLVVSGDVCKCTDGKTEYNSAMGKCELTNAAALEKQCIDGKGVWNAAAKTCACSDDKQEFNGTACVKKKIAEICDAIPEQAKWIAGECVCKDAGYIVDVQQRKCVESDETRTQRENAEKQEKRDQAKQAIVKIGENLKEKASKLNVSVWKDREGNFNTSRLVSDSVAGVVLGTAGGLITSNIVKKNQVKGGFEDINCSIGGQVVAGFGDEFQVGVK